MAAENGQRALDGSADLAKAYADPTRLRLLTLLGREELTVAELTAATRLVQSRVSSHLAKLREAQLVRVRRAGNSTFYALDEAGMSTQARGLWTVLRDTTADPLLEEDADRLRTVLAARSGSWADSVAGQMERHYSPGRTWEAAARGLSGLARLGDVLDVASGDGALAELVQRRARSVTCLDWSARVVGAAQRRFGHLPSVRLGVGDMHALPYRDASFDHVLLMNSLSYASAPRDVVAEVARVLRPSGTVVVVTLRTHRHDTVAAAYNHVQSGFEPEWLRELFESVGLTVSLCDVTSRERQQPHFEIITVYAERAPGRAGRRRSTGDTP